MDSDDPYWVNIRTFGGDDVIEGIGGNTSFIDGGDGNDLLVVKADNGSDGNIRAFGDFALVNGLADDRSHILFDVEKVQVYEGDGGSRVKTYNLESLGPTLDSAYITFFEDNYTKDESILIFPQSWPQNHFAIPATLAKHSPSSVTDFTFISKNFEDISGDDAKENRRSFELKGNFSYSGSDGLDTSGGLVELQELSGTTSRIDEYFGEFNISTERIYSSMYQEWLFQDKFLKNGSWTQEAYYGNDALISLNGIANGGFDISADGGPDFYTSYNDYIYGHAGNDYIFGGVGDDYIDGGQGNDVAIFLGRSTNYTITENRDGTYSVSDGSGIWPGDGTDTLVNIESLSFSDQDIALGNSSVISTINPTVSLPSVSSTRVDVSAKLESLKAGLPNAPTLPSLMDAASSGLPGPIFTLASTDTTGSSIEGSASTDTDTSDSGITADTVSFVRSAANEKFTAAAGKVKIKMDMRKEDLSISKVGDSGEWSITGTGIGTDMLSGFKRLEFEDGVLALDIDPGDTAGQAYRLYQAAFARVPDMPGVAYHMNDMESNGLSVVQIARNFIASPEFKTQYGENPTEDEYINLLYQNVLGRTPGQFEIDYYKERFESGTTDWNTTLVFFAESPENVSLVAPQIEDGIWMPF